MASLESIKSMLLSLKRWGDEPASSGSLFLVFTWLGVFMVSVLALFGGS